MSQLCIVLEPHTVIYAFPHLYYLFSLPGNFSLRWCHNCSIYLFFIVCHILLEFKLQNWKSLVCLIQGHVSWTWDIGKTEWLFLVERINILAENKGSWHIKYVLIRASISKWENTVEKYIFTYVYRVLFFPSRILKIFFFLQCSQDISISILSYSARFQYHPYFNILFSSFTCVYVSVCVCVCERERERKESKKHKSFHFMF